jgi:hypothetical protein
MGILFGFTAEDVMANVIDTTEGDDSTVVVTTPPTVGPISDAVNNVRFACHGFAAGLDFAGIDIRARSYFIFQIPEPGRITVHGHLTYGGVSTVIGQGATWLFDNPGFAKVTLMAKMRVRVRGENGEIIFTRSTARRTLFEIAADGSGGTTTQTAAASAGLLEQFLTVATPEVVLPDDSILVRVEYLMSAFAMHGGEFVADFDPGGLNVPMVVVNY